MTRGKVVMVGAPPVKALLDGAEAELNHRGHAFVRYASPAEFKAAKSPLAEGDVLVALGMPVTRELLASAKLRAVVSPFTGTEHIDVAAATELGIVVGFGQTPENTVGMAEATIMFMLVTLYDLQRAEKLLRESQPRPPQFGRLVRGKTVGLIGLGAIGRAIAQRLEGWEARVVAYTPRPRDVPENVEILGLDALLAASDVVMVVSSLNAETQNMLNAERLMKMKKDAVLINTSRGGIVDEAALVEVAKRGHLAKIALDVYETEPLPADSPLRGLPNAVLTPHIIGQTKESWQTLPVAVVQNMVRPMENKPPLYVRNPEVLPRWQERWPG
jgi:phosphoglycerate dehydrogenase-like enzyme